MELLQMLYFNATALIKNSQMKKKKMLKIALKHLGIILHNLLKKTNKKWLKDKNYKINKKMNFDDFKFILINLFWGLFKIFNL